MDSCFRWNDNVMSSHTISFNVLTSFIFSSPVLTATRKYLSLSYVGWAMPTLRGCNTQPKCVSVWNDYGFQGSNKPHVLFPRPYSNTKVFITDA